MAILAPMPALISATIERIDRCLPQTQCTRCGYPSCAAYAAALAGGGVEINRCPPGGDVTLELLAQVLGQPRLPLDPAVGPHMPRLRALIDETRCIGCRKCIDACPVDAIVGARKLMHTVLVDACTGCELCLPPCPVDCIDLVAVTRTNGEHWPEYADAEVLRWRDAAQNRTRRLARRKKQSAMRQRTGAQSPTPVQIRAEIADAVARVRAKRGK